jgi:hypothetical protein
LLTDTENPTELTSKLWGLPVGEDVAKKLDQEKLAEAGDILYFVSAAGLQRDIPLREIGKEAIEHYTGSDAIVWDGTISHFDWLLAGRMAEQVPPAYKPNYSTWKLWDFAPFENGLHIVLREPTHSKGPLTLIPDGRYALERLFSTFGRFMLPETSTDAEFLASAALALGGLSIVLQARFNSSLTRAAQNSITKRERRQALGTLVSGNDSERSRKQVDDRVTITDEQGTINNLLHAALPDTP